MSPRVKEYLGTLLYALIEAPTPLVVGLRVSNLGLALNRWDIVSPIRWSSAENGISGIRTHAAVYVNRKIGSGLNARASSAGWSGQAGPELRQRSSRRFIDPDKESDPYCSSRTKTAVVRAATVAEPALESKVDCRVRGSLECRCIGCKCMRRPARLISVNVNG
jgi:hypothetical protein